MKYFYYIYKSKYTNSNITLVKHSCFDNVNIINMISNWNTEDGQLRIYMFAPSQCVKKLISPLQIKLLDQYYPIELSITWPE